MPMLALALSLISALPQPVHLCSRHALLGPAPQEALAMDQWPTNKLHEDDPKEPAITNVRQLTFGGQNAEAYWSIDGQKLTFQSTQPEFPDEQIFTMNADGSEKTLRSTGLGRCTCSYFSPDGDWLYFSSTHERNKGPQAKVDMSLGYVWKVNPDFALYRVRLATPETRASQAGAGEGQVTTPADRQGVPEPVVKKPGYVAETTIAPNGKFMVFTGDFDDDIDIYRSTLDGKEVTRLTDELGYDGGPFVSWDSKTIVYRRGPLKTPEEEAEYKSLHAQHLVRPSKMDIWIMDADGRNKRQVTDLGRASFAPFLHPDGQRIIFSSNHHDPKGREFDLFIVNVDGTGLRQITFTPDFDGFPMFSRDGKRLAWASNRHGSVRGETNIFVADWVE